MLSRRHPALLRRCVWQTKRFKNVRLDRRRSRERSSSIEDCCLALALHSMPQFSRRGKRIARRRRVLAWPRARESKSLESLIRRVEAGRLSVARDFETVVEAIEIFDARRCVAIA